MQIEEIKTLNLALTNKCNGRCIMCWHSNKDPRGFMEIPENFYEQAKTLFPTIKVLDLISGGEVFLYSHINRLFEDSTEFNYLIKISTNGSVISNYHKELLSKLNVEFTVSLDATYAELHNKIRQGCSFNKAIETIKYFVDIGKKVYIRSCFSNHNFYEMQGILDLAEKLNVSGVKLQTVQYLDSVDKPYSFTKPPIDIKYLKSLKSKVKYSMAFDYFKKNPESPSLFTKLTYLVRHKYCPLNKNFLKIDMDGKIYSCSVVRYARILGDLRLNSLTNILKTCEPIRINCTCKQMEKWR